MERYPPITFALVWIALYLGCGLFWAIAFKAMGVI